MCIRDSVKSIDRVRATDSYTALDEPEEEGEEDDKKKKKHSAIPLLAGIAFGVVLFTVAFVIAVMWWMGVFTGQDGDLIEVPKVIGMTMEEAKLQYPDFTFEIKNTLYNTAPKDQIIEQDPSEGRKVEKGAAVQVVVSLGPTENVVPDLSLIHIYPGGGPFRPGKTRRPRGYPDLYAVPPGDCPGRPAGLRRLLQN